MTDSFDEILRIQRMMEDSARKELKEDRVSNLMALINSLVPEKSRIQVEKLFYVAETKGFSEKEIVNVIRKFVHDKILFQPVIGYIQRRQ